MSPESLNYCTTSGLITQLLRELTGEDVLVRYVGQGRAEYPPLEGQETIPGLSVIFPSRTCVQVAFS